MHIQEDFLHFIWQVQYFTTQSLHTETGEVITILDRGSLNSNAGPDFSEVKLKIGDITWAGHVEMHVKSSEWYAHKHDHDPAYENVILHVVWENDRPVNRQNHTSIPTLVLQGKVPLSLIERYKVLKESASKIPCSQQLPQVNRLTLLSMLDASLTQRLENKASLILEKLETNKGDWETTAYQVFCRNLGFKVNSDTFEQLAKQLPLKILQKHTDQNMQVEALLFGVAGFLKDDFKDDYLLRLQKEFQFLQKKYQLNALEKAQWKLLRMRPANFPSVRLAQFAATIHQQRGFFSSILHEENFSSFYQQFSVVPSSYWQSHYLPEKQSSRKIKGLGKESIHNLLINTVAPLLMAVGIYQQSTHFKSRAVSLLEQIPPESNKYTRLWKEEGMKLQSAFDTQASLELYQKYCSQKKCLSCKIGAEVLKGKS